MSAKTAYWVRQSEEPDWIHKAVVASAERLRAAGLAAAPFVKEGDPRLVLKSEAEQWQADCVFLGARGLSRGDRFLLGGVSSALAARALLG